MKNNLTGFLPWYATGIPRNKISVTDVKLESQAWLLKLWGAGMMQWWEHLPTTNVAQLRFPDPPSYVGWVCCWFSTLLRGFFLRVIWFSSLHKNQDFLILIRSGNSGWRATSWKCHCKFPFIFLMYFIIWIPFYSLLGIQAFCSAYS